MVEQLLAQSGRQIGLAVVEQRGNVVVQRAFAATLVVEKPRTAIAQHHVARLKIAIEKIIVRRSEQQLGQTAEVELQRLFVEGHAGQSQKVVLEIIQVPGDGLAVEAGARVADLVIEIAACLHLKARQLGDNFAIGLDHFGRNGVAIAIGAEKFEERGVAQILFNVSAASQILGIDLGDGQAMAAKMPGELEKGKVLFAHGVENADGGVARAGKADDIASRAAQLALKRLHAFSRRMKVLLEEAFKNVHEKLPCFSLRYLVKDSDAGERDARRDYSPSCWVATPSKRVKDEFQCILTMPVGPLRCLAMMISASAFSSAD